MKRETFPVAKRLHTQRTVARLRAENRQLRKALVFAESTFRVHGMSVTASILAAALAPRRKKATR